MSAEASKRSVILITGMSGSGKSIALKTFEDMGYETIDNLPLTYLEPVTRTPHTSSQPLAISVDVRTRGFSIDRFLSILETLSQDPKIHKQFIFFDCSDDVLVRRYNESRRLHPLAHERPVLDGLRLERHILTPLQDYADFVINSSELSVAHLKKHLRQCFLPQQAPTLSILVISFSYRYGLPREADIVIDARLLQNPFYDESLRHLSGEDPQVADYIRKDDHLAPLTKALQDLLKTSIPRFEEEGRTYLTVAVGCTGGQHRSVFIAKMIAEWLQKEKKHVKLKHRDLKKRTKK